MIRLLYLLLIIGLAGCGFHRTRNFPALGHVTAITVRESDAANLSPKITDSARVSQIVAFVDSHRGGWYAPWYGVPVPRVSIEVYEGTEFKGSFGVGKNFLETQRDGGFYSQDATSDEVNTFLALLAPTSGSQVAGIENGPNLEGDWKILSGVEQLPESVKTAFAALAHQPQFEMADPGRDFQVTDVITHEGLPRRRLIFAGISDRDCFIQYEMGGRGHSFYVVVFSRGPSEATFMWGKALSKPAANIAELRSQIHSTYGPPSSSLTY
jgi:hypothetical protein